MVLPCSCHALAKLLLIERRATRQANRHGTVWSAHLAEAGRPGDGKRPKRLGMIVVVVVVVVLVLVVVVEAVRPEGPALRLRPESCVTVSSMVKAH